MLVQVSQWIRYYELIGFYAIFRRIVKYLLLASEVILGYYENIMKVFVPDRVAEYFITIV